MMKIEELDKNFLYTAPDGCVWNFRSADSSPFVLYGVYYDRDEKAYMRIPASVGDSLPGSCVKNLSFCTAGGRVRFATNAKNIAIRATYRGLNVMPHMPVRGPGGYTLTESKDGKYAFKASMGPAPAGNEKEFEFCLSGIGNGEMKNYVLYMPLYNDVSALCIGTEPEAVFQPPAAYKPVPPVLYYGSSITQGGCASRADNAYEAYISEWEDVDFINLGFSGNARGEKEMAKYVSGIKSSVYVIDYDYNAPSVAHLQATHYPFYKIILENNPLTPIVFVTRPNYGFHPDDDDRIKVVRTTYLRAKKEGDKNVYFISGKNLFGKADALHMTVDGCHPTDLGFYRMAKVIGKTVHTLLSPSRK
ncbi:MAG: SGNH/GDSL hydrolase family protein [Clostridia bacterium]|nr:SGNH/GDSL hydrolase family protein [Clostridia bacterium]